MVFYTYLNHSPYVRSNSKYRTYVKAFIFLLVYFLKEPSVYFLLFIDSVNDDERIL